LSTELDIRFWLTDSTNLPAEAFAALTDSISNWHPAENMWTGIRIEDRTPGEILLDKREPLSIHDLHRIANPYRSRQVRFSSRVKYRCWRFDGVRPFEGFLQLRVEVWGEDFGDPSLRDRRIDGDGSLSVFTSGPYVALIKQELNEDVENVNQRVGENLANFRRLLEVTFSRAALQRIRVFTDAGAYLPFNAHFAMYDNVRAVEEDLALIVDAWLRGIPALNCPPLVSTSEHDDFMLHQWRTPNQRTTLRQRFRGILPASLPPSSAILDSALAYQNIREMRNDSPIEAGQEPYYLNSFIDRFFIDLLAGR
jgi:hypothetical protein